MDTDIIIIFIMGIACIGCAIFGKIRPDIMFKNRDISLFRFRFLRLPNDNLARFRNRLLCGEQLHLDEQHQQMAHHIYNDFTHLYPTLLTYYTQTIDTLKCADAIRQLRQQYYESTGMMAHEPDSSHTNITTVKSFWERFNKMLIC